MDPRTSGVAQPGNQMPGNERFERFLNGLSKKNAQKPLKNRARFERFERFL